MGLAVAWSGAKANTDSCGGGTAAEQPAGSAPLYLGFTVNGVAAARLVQATRTQTGLLVDRAVLSDLGLRWRDAREGPVALEAIPGISLRCNWENQAVDVTVPVSELDRAPTRLTDPSTGGDRPEVSPGLHGVLLNYDAYVQTISHGPAAGSLWTETRVLGVGSGYFSNSLLTQAGEGIAARTTRLDTYWRTDLPESMVSITAGDTYSSAVSWSRPVRLGGVRVSRNFALQPYRSTAPLSVLYGEAALPSTVELYLNGVRRTVQDVPPGPFQLETAPVVNGAGVARLVVTDILGQKRTIDVDVYGGYGLLQEGLWDWSFEAGFQRRSYGTAQTGYDSQPVASASARYGVSDRLTVEQHGEAGAGVASYGAGAVVRIAEQAGLLSVSLSSSSSGAGTGWQQSAGYQWSAGRFSLAAQSVRRSASFQDLAGLPAQQRLLASDSVFGSIGTGWGQFGIAFASQRIQDSEATRAATLNWSTEVGARATLSVSVTKELSARRAVATYASLTLPLSGNQLADISATRRGGSQSANVTVARGAPDNGWGWRVRAGETNGQGGGLAQVARTHTQGEWAAGVEAAPGGGTSAFASASGAVVMAGGGTYLSRRIDDSFALISTSGVPGVPVLLENRRIGTTDYRGYLLATQLGANQKNRVAVDTLTLPADMRTAAESLDVVPVSKGGALARFDIRKVRAVQAVLRDAKGEVLPAGTPVLVPGGAGAPPQESVVGYDGLVYLEDPPPAASLRAQPPEGECRASLPAEFPAQALELTCTP
ncbi:fimbria/pilus outer membrane usher protein [Ramlibacter humi]|nr:fimbria/pilus outer membrane usher protein [Ramlibacter humi]